MHGTSSSLAPRRRRFAVAWLPVLVTLALLVPVNRPAAAAVSLDTELHTTLEEHGYLDAWFATAVVEPELALVALEQAPTVQRGLVFDAIAQLDVLREQRRGAQIALRDLRLRRDRLVQAISQTHLALLAARTARADTVTTRTQTQDIRDRTQDHLDDVEDAVRDAAVRSYMLGAEAEFPTDVEAFNERAVDETMIGAALDDLLDRKHEVEGDLADLDGRLGELDDRIADIDDQIVELDGTLFGLQADRASTEADIDETTERIFSLTVDADTLDAEIPTLFEALHEERLTGEVAAVGLPLVVVDAYVRGARLATEIDPACAVQWPILAGIAAVESGHGTFGGAEVDDEGEAKPHILGVVLDGSLEGTAIITDTDGGAMDGSADFDRAVGPFQFIPGTWSRWAVDANDDGDADPHNMYDGAATAGVYLCASSDMATPAQVRRSILSYNHSAAYVTAVLAKAKVFESFRAPLQALDLGLDVGGDDDTTVFVTSPLDGDAPVG